VISSIIGHGGGVPGTKTIGGEAYDILTVEAVAGTRSDANGLGRSAFLPCPVKRRPGMASFRP
jgi:hypothetical protein